LLNEEELAIINKDRYSVTYKKDELILKQGISATHIISLIDGMAKVYIEGLNNRNLLLRILKPWTLIDETGLETKEKNQFSITAITDCKVCFIDAKNFSQVLAENSKFACEVIRHRSRHAIFCLDRMVSLTQKQMLGRMADGLIYLSRNVYDSDTIVLDLSRQDIADLTSMSKDSAIRMLKELEKDGIIDLKGNSLHILKETALEQIAARG
jgi:CRP/FNR family transcriptional regulator